MGTTTKKSMVLYILISILGLGIFLFTAFHYKQNHDELSEESTVLKNQSLSSEARIPGEMVEVKGGIVEMSEKGMKVKLQLKTYAIDKDLVTVADFAEFVKATGYKTEAEEFGNAAVFDFVGQGWSLIDGAYYLFPRGPQYPQALPNHPVTQVSWNDAQAYAKWKGKRLPTVAEWEWAAQSAGKSKTLYSWGNEMNPGNKIQANYWQGQFPEINTKEDGYLTTSPVGAFGANSLGLTDMGGNVWQWCADSIAPTAQEAALDPAIRKVTKGGSFLCDPKVCHGFRIDGHSSPTAETALFHTGFRCVKDL